MLRIVFNYFSIQQRRVGVVQSDGFLYHLPMRMRRYPNSAIGNLLSDPPKNLTINQTPASPKSKVLDPCLR